MYCVYDSNEHVIAFHDDYNVVETYVRRIQQSHVDDKYNLPDLRIGKIKKKKVKHIREFDDLYLVRYSDTYVQSGYLEYLEIVSCQCIYDNQQCKDILLRILECNQISNKERKSIEKTVEIVDRLLKDAKEFTPTISELKMYEADYSPYLYNRGVY